MIPKDGPREDVLISVCCPVLPASAGEIEAFSRLSKRISEAFAYFEFVVTTDGALGKNINQLFEKVDNLRVLRVSREKSVYQRRTIVASEAIGDVILFVDPGEIDLVDPIRVIDVAERDGRITYAARKGFCGLSSGLELMGRASGLAVLPVYLRTAAYPRGALNRALLREDRELALRFPPLDRKTKTVPASGRPGRGWSKSGITQRVDILQKLMVNSSSTVLNLVSVASLLIMVFSLFLGGYGFMAAFWVESLAPGYSSLMVALAAIAMVFGAALFGISAGLQKVIRLLDGEQDGEVLEELGGQDLFASVRKDYNVELSGSG